MEGQRLDPIPGKEGAIVNRVLASIDRIHRTGLVQLMGFRPPNATKPYDQPGSIQIDLHRYLAFGNWFRSDLTPMDCPGSR